MLRDDAWWVLDPGSARLEAGRPTRVSPSQILHTKKMGKDLQRLEKHHPRFLPRLSWGWDLVWFKGPLGRVTFHSEIVGRPGMFHYASDPCWYLLAGEEAPCPNPELFAPRSDSSSLAAPCKQDPARFLRQSPACGFPLPPPPFHLPLVRSL